MKLNVIVDRDGVIVGTVPASPKAEGKDAPVVLGFTPGAGRTTHKLDIPKEAAALGFDALRQRYRVSLRGQGKLVKVRERRPQPAAPPAPAAAKPAAASAKKKG